jgi:hypothetical protein
MEAAGRTSLRMPGMCHGAYVNSSKGTAWPTSLSFAIDDDEVELCGRKWPAWVTSAAIAPRTRSGAVELLASYPFAIE